MSDKNHSSHKEAIQLDWKLDTSNKKSNSSKYNMRPGSIQKRGSSRLLFCAIFSSDGEKQKNSSVQTSIK